jgi:hypothetical protein
MLRSQTFGGVLPLALFALTGCALTSETPAWSPARPVHLSGDSTLAGGAGYYAAAVHAIESRDYARALDLLQAADERSPGEASVANAFGVVYDKLGRFDLSARYYAQAKAADPGSSVVANNIAYSGKLQRRAQDARPRTVLGQTAAAVRPQPAAKATTAPVMIFEVVSDSVPTKPLNAAEVATANRISTTASLSNAGGSGAPRAPRPMGPYSAAAAVALRPTTDLRRANPLSQPPAIVQAAGVAANLAPRRLPPLIGRGLEVANASGKPYGIEPVRLTLLRRGWSAPSSGVSAVPVAERSRILYAPAKLLVAQGLARTLPYNLQLASCRDCRGVRLVLGRDSLRWPLSAQIAAPRRS